MTKLSTSLVRRLAVAIFGLAALLSTGIFESKTEAAPPQGKWVKEYHVQVEYLLWDYDTYYWETVYKSENYDAANFVYQFSLLAKQNGDLNQMWKHAFWKMIAVDVRLVWEWKFKPAPPITDSRVQFP